MTLVSFFACADHGIQWLTLSLKSTDVEMDLGDANIDDFLFKPLQNLVNHARNAKVLTKSVHLFPCVATPRSDIRCDAPICRKLLRRFDDLVSNSSALNLDHAEGFETLAYNSTAIAQAVSKVSSRPYPSLFPPVVPNG